MRLKKDHSGWRSSGLWKKYKFPRVDERKPKHKSKKDTKQWCRGKEGEKHEYEMQVPKNAFNGMDYWIVAVCQKCGKQNKSEVLYYNNHTKEYTREFPVTS